MMEVKVAEINGKRIAYTDQSVFLVQVGRGRGAYRTKYAITGSLGQACFYYRCVNVGNGYKKRLVCESLNKPLIARQFS